MALYFPQVNLLPLERYASILGTQRMQEIALRIAELRARLAGRVIWNVSSSFSGGGVAEMVRSLLAYARGADVDARWAVIRGPTEFFKITKRLHNAIHGNAGDRLPLGDEERKIYEEINRVCASELLPLLRPQDIVIIHDPQPAGMIPQIAQTRAHVIWRCHIGSDLTNEETCRGWRFLTPYLTRASAYVFSRTAYIPAQLDINRATIIPPSIDPFSAKNQHLSEASIHSILVHSGIIEGSVPVSSPTFVREDGTPGHVKRFAEVLRQGNLPSYATPLVLQVSRWDRLKDPLGLVQGFAQSQGQAIHQSSLMLAGPSSRSTQDDPEDTQVYRSLVEIWRSLPEKVRSRIYLVSVPMVDIEENAAVINALQRHATVVVQKSISEGFGLTVTEALWKSRPVIASAVGGIQDQIDNGVDGMLLHDPHDLSSFGKMLETLLSNSQLRKRLGENGHNRVASHYLGIDSLLHYGSLIENIDSIGAKEIA